MAFHGLPPPLLVLLRVQLLPFLGPLAYCVLFWGLLLGPPGLGVNVFDLRGLLSVRLFVGLFFLVSPVYLLMSNNPVLVLL